MKFGNEEWNFNERKFDEYNKAILDPIQISYDDEPVHLVHATGVFGQLVDSLPDRVRL
jgi:hypothetical protein